MTPDLGFIHHFSPAPPDHESPCLLLLHGTGGNEHDLLDLGHSLALNAALLSPRGKVLENGMPRFFRRRSEGVFDLEDLKFRTTELADFIERARIAYHLPHGKIIAVGYSNGANIAASLLLTRPDSLSGAILFRAMGPFIPDALPQLTGVPIFIAAGRQDPIVAPKNSQQLAALLEKSGARVTLHWSEGGHGLEAVEIEQARLWLERQLGQTQAAVETK